MLYKNVTNANKKKDILRKKTTNIFKIGIHMLLHVTLISPNSILFYEPVSPERLNSSQCSI